MTDKKFGDRIGEVLGVNLALFEEDLRNDPDDINVMEKIRLISEAYKNFSSGGLQSFQDDFESGYQWGKRDMRAGREPSSPTPNAARDDFDMG